MSFIVTGKPSSGPTLPLSSAASHTRARSIASSAIVTIAFSDGFSRAIQALKRDVMAGSTNASHTTEAGLRLSICAAATAATIFWLIPLIASVRPTRIAFSGR